MTAVGRVARQLANHGERLRALERAPQLAHSSVTVGGRELSFKDVAEMAATPPAVGEVDGRTPATPQGLTLTALSWVNSLGEVEGQAAATWEAVTAATDGTEMAVTRYEVSIRRSEDGARWVFRGVTDEPQAVVEALEPGLTIEVGVRACAPNSPRVSDMATAVITIPQPKPLDPPTPFTVTSDFGMVTIEWDGKLQGDDAPYTPPPYFRHVIVEEAATPEGPWRAVGSLIGSPMTVLDRMERMGDTLRYRGRSVDWVQRTSEPGAVSSVTVRSQVSEQVGAAMAQARQAADAAEAAYQAALTGVVDAGRLAGGSINATFVDALLASDVFAERIAAHQVIVATPQDNLITGWWGDPATTSSITQAGWEWDAAPTVGNYRGAWKTVGGRITVWDVLNAPELAAGDEFSFECWAKSSATDTTLTVRALNETGQDISGWTAGASSVTRPINGLSLGAAWRQFTATLKPSAAARLARIHIEVLAPAGAAVHVRLRLRKRAAAILIQDGAITAPKIASNSIATEHLAANSVTGGKLAFDAIDGKTVRGVNIIGSTFQSTDWQNGLYVWPTGSMRVSRGGASVWDLAASSGQMKWTDPSTGLNILIAPNYGGQSRPLIRFSDNTGAALSSQIFAALDSQADWIDGRGPGTLVIHGNESTANRTGRAQIMLGPGHGWHIENTKSPYINPTIYTRVSGGAGGTWTGEGLNTTLLGRESLRLEAGNTVHLQASNGAVDMSARGAIQLKSNSGDMRIPGLPSTTGGRALAVTDVVRGYLAVQGSARRLKTGIQDVDASLPERLLEVPVRDWRDRHELDMHQAWREDRAADGRQTGLWDEWEAEPRRIPGVVAEEVEAAGLPEYVHYGPNGEVEGVRYDRLWTLLIPLVKDLRGRVAALENVSEEEQDA